MIGFETPAILAGLILLPGIWWLLRVIPPAPRTIRFPAIRLLRDLVTREETPARTPLWLILMRMALAALLIVGLAGPILSPSAAPPGRSPDIIVVDNGWSAASAWSTIKAALLAEIDRAERAGMTVVIVPTARPAAGGEVQAIGPTPAAEARRAVENLQPLPWLPDRAGTADLLARFDGRSPALYLSDGIDSAEAGALVRAVAGFTAPALRTPERVALPMLVLPPDQGVELTLKVVRPADGPSLPVILIAHGEDGRILGQATASFAGDQTVASARFDLPAEIRNQIARIDVAGPHGAGGTVLLDERWRRRPVAVVTPPKGSESSELLSGDYYLARALAPFAEVRTGALGDLIKGQPAVIALTDDVTLSPGETRDLTDWIAKGGLLLRFAGPRLAAAEPGTQDALLPTALRTGGRSLNGAMSWTTPATLAPFTDGSPFTGLEIPPDVTVSRQILAEPSLELDRKVWVRLSDGTPLITADRRDDGTVVLIHTSADPTWSNLALSGLFPQMLRRIVAYSAGTSHAPAHGVLEPYRVLDGFGRLTAPGGAAAALAVDRFDGALPDPQHPPGYYGEVDSSRAFNLTQSLTGIAPLAVGGARLDVRTYAAPGTVSLAPWLLGLAMALAIADTLVALWLGGSLPAVLGLRQGVRRLRPGLGGAAALIAALVLATGIAKAGPIPADAEQRVAEAAAQVTLGYVTTGDPDTDRVSKAGLQGLARQLILRTSIDHAAPAEVNLETDELSVYPLLYWPISASARPLSDQAKDKLNRYLSTGGMILIDTRAGATGMRPDLGRLIQGLDIPALTPIPAGHVLTKSFYLLDMFPGRVPGGDLFVERDHDARNDGVSSVVVGDADWAGAWAIDSSNIPLFRLAPGGERQREWSYRFGVNLVMYALTGNYKADLVHAPFIQQRLGQ